MNIIEKLKELGYSTVPEEFYTKVQEWKSWYEGDVKGFHRYRVRNGAGMVRCKRYTLNMGKKIPEDWAKFVQVLYCRIPFPFYPFQLGQYSIPVFLRGASALCAMAFAVVFQLGLHSMANRLFFLIHFPQLLVFGLERGGLT